MELDLLSIFVSVVDTASFSAAARRLGMPKSSVSRAIAKLESDLGVQLLHRTTRHVAPSTAGAALYARTAPLLASLREAVGSMPEKQELPSGDLRLTAPFDMGVAVLPEILTRFTALYPAIRPDVRLTNRLVDLVSEGFDVALRIAGKLEDSSLVVKKLSRLEMQLYASPSYLARRGTPRTPADVTEHDWLSFRGAALPRIFGRPSRPARVVADDLLFMREALRSGAGLGILPTFLASEELAAGLLARVLPAHAEPAGTLYFVHPATRNVPRKVTLFRDFLGEWLAARPVGGA